MYVYQYSNDLRYISQSTDLMIHFSLLSHVMYSILVRKMFNLKKKNQSRKCKDLFSLQLLPCHHNLTLLVTIVWGFF